MFNIIVGNIGVVAEYACEKQARATFAEYVLCSKELQGRAAGESVTLIEGGEILAEHIGALDSQEYLADQYCD